MVAIKEITIEEATALRVLGVQLYWKLRQDAVWHESYPMPGFIPYCGIYGAEDGED
jgi:hypothetical protein